MEKTAELIKQITERLNRRPARIDKADRLWDAAVLVPLIDTKQGPAVLFEVRAAGLGWQPGDVCFPGGRYECGDDSFAKTAVRMDYAGIPRMIFALKEKEGEDKYENLLLEITKEL